MKKSIVIFLVFVTIFSMVACGNKEVGEANEIANLYAEGFTPTMWSMSDSTWAGIFQKEMSYDQVYVVTLKVSKSENEKINDANMEDDSDKALKNIISYIPEPIIEDITSQIPGEEEINSLVGKTLSEIEEMGYFSMGDFHSEGKHVYTYDNSIYSVNLELDTDDINDWNDISPNELLDLKVKAVEFSGFSSLFLESKF